MSGSSYWPRSAVKAYGIAPRSRIHASAQLVSRPPENAIPTRSPTGSDERITPVASLTLTDDSADLGRELGRSSGRRSAATKTVLSPAIVPATSGASPRRSHRRALPQSRAAS